MAFGLLDTLIFRDQLAVSGSPLSNRLIVRQLLVSFARAAKIRSIHFAARQVSIASLTAEIGFIESWQQIKSPQISR